MKIEKRTASTVATKEKSRSRASRRSMAHLVGAGVGGRAGGPGGSGPPGGGAPGGPTGGWPGRSWSASVSRSSGSSPVVAIGCRLPAAGSAAEIRRWGRRAPGAGQTAAITRRRPRLSDGSTTQRRSGSAPASPGRPAGAGWAAVSPPADSVANWMWWMRPVLPSSHRLSRSGRGGAVGGHQADGQGSLPPEVDPLLAVPDTAILGLPSQQGAEQVDAGLQVGDGVDHPLQRRRRGRGSRRAAGAARWGSPRVPG